MTFPSPRKHADDGGIESWLMSYADMITLLLCFFIIFVSTSEPKQDQLAAATKGMQAKFGTVDLSTPFTGAFMSVQGIIDSNQLYQDLSVEKTDRGMRIELSTTAFYQPESAEFNASRMPILTELAKALQDKNFSDYTVYIEGHTDDVPTTSGLYASNWELSAVRATRMVRFFIDQGFDPTRMVAEGHADTKPRVPNADGAGTPISENRERNRRVVVTLERKF